MRRRWTDEQLRDAVARARSVHGVFRLLGLRPGGGQHVLVKEHITRLGLDTSHFTGKRWNRGLTGIGKPIIPLDKILVEHSTYHDTSKLKKRLLHDGLLQPRCYLCGAPPTWREMPLVLRLDHINGDRCDHRLQNLRLLCPNCDSQTPTFAGRNKGRKS